MLCSTVTLRLVASTRRLSCLARSFVEAPRVVHGSSAQPGRPGRSISKSGGSFLPSRALSDPIMGLGSSECVKKPRGDSGDAGWRLGAEDAAVEKGTTAYHRRADQVVAVPPLAPADERENPRAVCNPHPSLLSLPHHSTAAGI